MKRKITFLTSAILPVLVLFPAQLHAYETDNHSVMTAFAIQNSIFYVNGEENQELLARMGLAPSIYYQYFEETLFGTMDQSMEDLTRQSVMTLIRNGAIEEDELLPWYWTPERKKELKQYCDSLPELLLPRVNNHFFDARLGVDDADAGLSSGNLVLGAASPHWALEQAPNDAHPNQYYSYRLFKDYLEAALTEKVDFEEAYGFAFESLGHVVHHIQDMAQPAHVRNDSHCPNNFCAPIQAALEACETYDVDQDLYNSGGGSDFEKFASFHYKDDSAPAGDFSAQTFASAERFWTSSGGHGLADFTSRNFVSPDTNFSGTIGQFTPPEGFVYPDVSNAQTSAHEDVALLYPDYVGLEGKIAAVRTPLVDPYTGANLGYAHRTSTYSLFSKDIKLHFSYWGGREEPIVTAIQESTFTLNRLNYHSAYQILMPMAIRYSAGFINFAFRGKLEIAKPDRGIYAVADQARGQPFTSLRLKVRNATADITDPESGVTPQDATDGMLTAVVSYRPNPCYKDDLSGELHIGQELPDDCTLEQFNDVTLQRSVASIYRGSGISSDDWEEIEFDFSADPIPLSARDVQVRLVYRGQLGLEEDGIAIGHRDISEPTWVVIHNSTDVISVDGVNQLGDIVLGDQDFLDAWEIDTSAEIQALSKQQIRDLKISYNAFADVIAGPALLNAYGYTRIAILGELWNPGNLEFSGQFATDAATYSAELPAVTGIEVPAQWDLEEVGDHQEFKPKFCLEGHGCLASRLLDFRGVSGFYINVWQPSLGDAPADLESLGLMPMPYVEEPSPMPVDGE